MAAAESGRREERQLERRAEPARRTSRLIYPKTAARGLHQSSPAGQNQNPQNGHLLARFDWGFGAACFGASPVAAVFGSAPGSATSPKHRIQFNPAPPGPLSKQDISTLLGIGHFYFALTREAGERALPGARVRRGDNTLKGICKCHADSNPCLRRPVGKRRNRSSYGRKATRDRPRIGRNCLAFPVQRGRPDSMAVAAIRASVS